MKNHASIRIWLAVIPATLVAIALVSIVNASSVTIPNTFVAGNTAVANQVNQNFTAVKAAIDDNDTRLDAIAAGTPNGIVKAAAHIDSGGTVSRFFNLLGGTPTVTHVGGSSTYIVKFPGFTNLNTRFYTAVTGNAAVGTSVGFVSITPAAASPTDSLFISTFDTGGSGAERSFYVVVY